MNRFATIFERWGLDKAVLLAAASRSWQSVAGVVSLLCIVHFFTIRLQGYHYAFLSMISAQGLFELGIGIAILSFASHEWSALSFDSTGRAVGDATRLRRLAAIARFACRWYAWMAGLFLLGGSAIGWFVIGRREAGTIQWLGPWMLVICSASANLFISGALAVIEGCNQIMPVARIRLVQSVLGNLVFWACAAAGFGLWSTGWLMLTMTATAASLVVGRYGRFVVQLYVQEPDSDVSWRSGLFAMQWPLAIQAAAGFFMFSFFVPAVFRTSGAHEAGQLGMSLQVVLAILSVAAALITVRQPRLGVLVARGEITNMTADWRRGSAAALTGYLLVSSAVLVIAHLATLYLPSVRGRVLGVGAFAMLAAWGLATLSVQCLATYWRAFRVEPLGAFSVLPGLASGALIWVGAIWSGATGAVAGALLAVLSVTVPLALVGWRRTQTRFRSAIAGGAG